MLSGRSLMALHTKSQSSAANLNGDAVREAAAYHSVGSEVTHRQHRVKHASGQDSGISSTSSALPVKQSGNILACRTEMRFGKKMGICRNGGCFLPLAADKKGGGRIHTSGTDRHPYVSPGVRRVDRICRTCHTRQRWCATCVSYHKPWIETQLQKTCLHDRHKRKRQTHITGDFVSSAARGAREMHPAASPTAPPDRRKELCTFKHARCRHRHAAETVAQVGS